MTKSQCKGDSSPITPPLQIAAVANGNFYRKSRLWQRRSQKREWHLVGLARQEKPVKYASYWVDRSLGGTR